MKIGQLWLPQVLVNNVYFCGKKRPSLERREVLKCRIFEQKGLQLKPGRLRQDVGEILQGELCSAMTLNG
jgi:hypothetical protein